MINLRHARLNERKAIYEWLCFSDTTPMHMGLPDYPESPVPSWEEFLVDFEPFYFSQESRHLGSVMVIEKDGTPIGAVCYACFHLRPGAAELDIWLSARAHCGQGYGTEALRQLTGYLRSQRGIHRFIIRPSEKNARAIRAYEKTGFRRVADKAVAVEEYLMPEYLGAYGAGDYGFEQTAVMICE